MAVWATGAVPVVSLAESVRPPGTDSSRSVAGCASRRTLVVAESPPGSVAVSRSSRYDG